MRPQCSRECSHNYAKVEATMQTCNSDNGNTVATATMATLFTKHLRGAKVLHGGTLRNWFCIKNTRNFNNCAWLSFSTSLFLAFGHNFRVLVINACHQRMSSTQSPNSLGNIYISKDSRKNVPGGGGDFVHTSFGNIFAHDICNNNKKRKASMISKCSKTLVLCPRKYCKNNKG